MSLYHGQLKGVRERAAFLAASVDFNLRHKPFARQRPSVLKV
jgi:hypothetical protein